MYGCLPQRPLMSELTYAPDETKRLMIEWHDGDLGPASRTETVTISGPGGDREVDVAVPPGCVDRLGLTCQSCGSGWH